MRSLIKNIEAVIKSRLIFNKNLTEEQKRRLKICSTCPLNSENQKKKTFKVELLILLNKFLDFLLGVNVKDDSICTKCGCNLVHKSIQEDEELKCPEKKW